jgi:hypothetical protein
MKRGSVLSVAFLMIVLVLSMGLILGCPPADDDGDGDPNTNITGLQWALYTDPDYTPLYSTLASDLVYDTWTTVSINVDLAGIGYDGFNSGAPVAGDQADWVGLDKLRLAIATATAGEEFVIYFDNVVMTNGTTTPINLNYDSLPGAYFAKGTELSNNNTAQTIDGETCVEIHAETAEQFGSVSAENQYDLSPDNVDCSNEDYAVSFDYYIPSTLP